LGGEDPSAWLSLVILPTRHDNFSSEVGVEGGEKNFGFYRMPFVLLQ
jgi:hypothetical protein